MPNPTIPRGFTQVIPISYDGSYQYNNPGDWIIFQVINGIESPVANVGAHNSYPNLPDATYGWAVSPGTLEDPGTLDITTSSESGQGAEGDYRVTLFASPTHEGSFASEPYSGYFTVGPPDPPPPDGPGPNPPSCGGWIRTATR
jgi:hypothetical protein